MYNVSIHTLLTRQNKNNEGHYRTPLFDLASIKVRPLGLCGALSDHVAHRINTAKSRCETILGTGKFREVSRRLKRARTSFWALGKGRLMGAYVR
jgi:hypothetical protein